MGLFLQRPADSSFTEKHNGREYDVELWDTSGLTFTKDYPRPVRVVWSKEEVNPEPLPAQETGGRND